MTKGIIRVIAVFYQSFLMRETLELVNIFSTMNKVKCKWVFEFGICLRAHMVNSLRQSQTSHNKGFLWLL